MLRIIVIDFSKGTWAVKLCTVCKISGSMHLILSIFMILGQIHKTLHQQNPPVLNLRCRLTQVDLLTAIKLGRCDWCSWKVAVFFILCKLIVTLFCFVQLFEPWQIQFGCCLSFPFYAYIFYYIMQISIGCCMNYVNFVSLLCLNHLQPVNPLNRTLIVLIAR